jgi:hypothetical protein
MSVAYEQLRQSLKDVVNETNPLSPSRQRLKPERR